MSRPAFITGSRAYGTPRPDSDIDLVVFTDFDSMLSVCNRGEENSRILSGSDGKANYGMLNLILVTSETQYDLWLKGTEELKLRAVNDRPVTRAEAKAHFTAMGLTNQVSGDDVA